MATAEVESRRWTLTLNNYTEKDWTDLMLYKSDCCYMAHEVGESGTPHIQGYFEFRSCKKFSVLTKHFPRGHWEPAKGTAEQNKDYILLGHGGLKPIPTKTFSSGAPKPKEQGKRSDLDGFSIAVQDNTNTLAELCERFPGMCLKYSGHMLRVRYFAQKDRDFKTIGISLYGGPGTGKSRVIRECFPGDEAYWKPDNSKWWDGYDQHQVVVWDDFRAEADISLPYVLRLLDRYPLQVQVKGGFVKFRSDVVIFTSPEPITHYFGGDENLRQLERRLTAIPIERINGANHLQGIIEAMITAEVR